MKVSRSISMGPRRGAEQTCTGIADFVAEILRDRAYPDAETVRAGFAKIFPLVRLLLTTRNLADPALTVQMPDLEIGIQVSYDPDFDEDLTLPNLVLLDKLTATDPVLIRLHGQDEITGPLSALPAAASTKTIAFRLAPPADPAAQPIDPLAEPPVAQEADEEPGQEPDEEPEPPEDTGQPD